MNKPNNYDITQAFGDIEQLKPGIYICEIIGVKETTSQSGKEMIQIRLDISEGEGKGFFAAKFKADTRTEKKWGCVVYQLVEDSDGNTNRGLKTFHDAVEASNPSFKLVWGSDYANSFKGCKIGCAFGREQYKNQKGEPRWSTKCSKFLSVETAKSGKIKIPEDKYLPDEKAQSYSGGSIDEYQEIGTSDGNLPFQWGLTNVR